MKVFIACPAFGQQMNSQTAASIIALTQQLTMRGIFGGFSAQTQPDIVDLRNAFVSLWYDCLDATHMLFVDADMQFEPELVLDMIEADQPLVGCLYPKKRLPISWVGSALEPPAQPEGNLLELEGLGCGVMLIRKDCITSMIETGNVEIEENPQGVLKELLAPHGTNRVIRAFDRVNDDGRRLSEDFSFCFRHRKAGGKVYAVTNHVLCHLGLMQFVGKYSDLYKGEANGGPSTGSGQESRA